MQLPPKIMLLVTSALLPDTCRPMPMPALMPLELQLPAYTLLRSTSGDEPVSREMPMTLVAVPPMISSLRDTDAQEFSAQRTPKAESSRLSTPPRRYWLSSITQAELPLQRTATAHSVCP
jgi:hypothetical protein